MSPEDKQATFREAKILEVLNHPNIIRFKEVYKTKQGQLCIVMDYADGKSYLPPIVCICTTSHVMLKHLYFHWLSFFLSRSLDCYSF